MVKYYITDRRQAREHARAFTWASAARIAAAGGFPLVLSRLTLQVAAIIADCYAVHVIQSIGQRTL